MCSVSNNCHALCGVVTDRDLVVRAIAGRRNAHTTPVREVMSRDVAYCHTDDSITEAQRLMMAHSVRRLPVIERASHALVGVVSIDDIARSASATRAAEILRWVAELATFSESVEG